MYDMKRQQDRDSSPKGKRSRYGYDDDIRDRLSPDRLMDRRNKRSSVVSEREMKMRERDYDHDDILGPDSERYSKRFKHDRAFSDPYIHQSSRVPDRQNIEGQGEFRTLCVSSINPQIPDTVVRDTLFKDFKKFGELNIKIVHNTDRRVVYLNYRYQEDAIDARLSRKHYMLFDSPVRIEPVFIKNRRRPDENPAYFDLRNDFRGRAGSPGRGRGLPLQGGDIYARDGDSFGFEKMNRSEPKFPHHMQHINPEDDPNATRTLFAGNLDYNITEPDLREIFEPYGDVEEIDIKRPQKGAGNAFAFVKFRNLDMAHRAKVSFSGEYIGRYQCKIGYGKVNATTCLWIGGLGPWVKPETLEQEFDRFGAIHQLEWPRGKNYAYILYDNVDAAQAANTEMRGFAFGGPDRRIRVDFADPAAIIGGAPIGSPPRRQDSLGSPPPGYGSSSLDRKPVDRQWSGNRPDNWSRERDSSSYRSVENPSNIDFDRSRKQDNNHRGDSKRSRSPYDDDRSQRHRSRTPMDNQDFSPVPERGQDRCSVTPPRRRKSSPDSSFGVSHSESNRDNVEGRQVSNAKNGNIADASNVVDFSKFLPAVWKGALVLKSSAFGCRFYHITGDVNLVDTLIGDSETGRTLRITQRLRLDQPKLDEVGRRVESSGSTGHAVLLALPSNATNENSNGSLQARPLKNLVSYLKQKEAAGVISLPAKQGKDEGGVLHAFPPCHFGQKYLLQRAPNLGSEPCKEDHLVIIIVRGA